MILPKRHRTHQLETESVLEFRSRLPSTWVYRTPSDDYGIDGEVEIFDDDGVATGKRFLVQLKATDEKNISRALKLKLPVKSANYFRRLNCPVLVVRYVSVRREIYSRWFHSFDPYLEGGTDKALPFKFSPSDLWGSERPESLKAELDEFLRFESSKQPFPIELPILFASDFPLAEKAAKLASELIEESRKYSNIVKLKVSRVPNEKPPSYVIFDKEKLHVVVVN